MLRPLCSVIAIAALSASLAAAQDNVATPAQIEFFEMQVRPLLDRHCFACHTQSKMGGLAINSRENLLRGGKSGPAIKPGDPNESLAIQAIRHANPQLKMPPSGKLPAADIEVLARWVKDGAIWPDHPATAPKADGYKITAAQRAWWSLQPVRKPAPPAVTKTAWPKTDIDRFLLAGMESNGLQPVAPADRRTLLRRVSYDLTGLPPTPEQVDAFLADKSSGAYAKVVEQLLASQSYGERWGRHWLDVARYADEKYSSTEDDPYPNAWRYRDWVIKAMNDDMPYDAFLKAQIAGDQMDPAHRDRYIAGLGFFSLSPEQQDDRVDALTRGMLGFTVACAQCHDHKFDPIPTKDYYSLLGIFRSTKLDKFPLVPAETVAGYEQRKAAAEAATKRLDEYLDQQSSQLAEILASQSARYFTALRDSAAAGDLDPETLERLKEYLAQPKWEHPFLAGWPAASFDVAAFQQKLGEVYARKKTIDRENMVALGGKNDDNAVRVIEVKSLPRDEYFLWRDFFQAGRVGKAESGVFYFKAAKLDRWLSPAYLGFANQLRATAETLKKAVPEMYPYYQVVADVEKPKNIRVEIKGNRDNLGEEAPRGFLTALCPGEPEPFTKGSGRLELAEAIASPDNPLTARVIVNRIWMGHFGRGLVTTLSNFGQLGEKPSNPALLDYLAARLIEQGWSLKALHREIVLSAAYQQSARVTEPNLTKDPDNNLVWHWARRRLDAEPLRDTLLFLSGELDATVGGQPVKLADATNLRRTVYGSISRRKLDGTLSLFDFPNPVATSEQRIHTATPLQQLFFLNSEFIKARAKALADRVASAGPNDPARIRAAYRILLQREPEKQEVKLGLDYLSSAGASWPRYAQALLGESELLFVD